MDKVTATGPAWVISETPVAYPDAIQTMRERAAGIRAGTSEEQVWLVEHPPLYSAGTSARPDELTDPHRFDTFIAGRGGQWTYHGPGQIVAYVMLDLGRAHGIVPAYDTHAYVAGLETWLLTTLSHFGIRGERRHGRVGIWVVDARMGTEAKIAAIGVRITRWVSWHGVSLNVRPNLDHFASIVPCGIREHGVTSLHALGSTATVDEVRHVLRARWSDVFGEVPTSARLKDP